MRGLIMEADCPFCQALLFRFSGAGEISLARELRVQTPPARLDSRRLVHGDSTGGHHDPRPS